MLAWEQEVHARNISPVKSMGAIKKGKPTIVEQNSISICKNGKQGLILLQSDQIRSDQIRWEISSILLIFSDLGGFRIEGKDSLLKIPQKSIHN